MSDLLTLVSPSDHNLAEELTHAVTKALKRAGARTRDASWLCPGRAWDLPFGDLRLPEAANLVVQALAGAKVDFALQGEATRRKKLLLADMESTVIRNEMLDEMAQAIGVGEQVAEITARAMHGDIDFADSLRQRAALLRRQPTSLLHQMMRRVEVDPGAASLVASMTAGGARAVLISGGFGAFVGPVCRGLGFHAYRANELDVERGFLTGAVRQPILDRGAKLRALLEECEELGIEAESVLAVGDGANDLDMLRGAGLGVAYHAKPIVAEQALGQVRYGDLSTLLYFQGYAKGEILDPKDRPTLLDTQDHQDMG
jgi:phosphoserine phosphatase